MSVTISGLSPLLRELEQRFGETRVQQISDQALKDGAKVFVKELEKQFETFKDTGGSIEEITVSEPMTMDNARTIKIHWRGPKGRYRIIHLNEFGTVKNPNPEGKGAIARALRNAEDAYRLAIRQAVVRGF